MSSQSDQCHAARIGTRSVRVKRNNVSKPTDEDYVAIEEPLEIRLGYGPIEKRQEHSLSITMRTPGNDRELGVGFLLTEGLITHPDEVAWVTHCSNTVAPGGTTSNQQNVLRVELDEDVVVDLESLQRHFYTTSSCGVCGKASLEALETQGQFKIEKNAFNVSGQNIRALPEKLAALQQNFSSTGGIHAAASFDQHGEIQQVFEDVGRHNALDKLIGHYTLQSRLPMNNLGIIVSGRVSFELVQKIMMAGCPLIAAIGAPSSLAIDAAENFNIDLIGFLKAERFNQYT